MARTSFLLGRNDSHRAYTGSVVGLSWCFLGWFGVLSGAWLSACDSKDEGGPIRSFAGSPSASSGSGGVYASGAGGTAGTSGVSAGSGGTLGGIGGSATAAAGRGSDGGAAMGQAGSGSSVMGTPYVFAGSTDGSLRAYTLSRSDGSLSPAGQVDVGDDLDFLALGPDDRTLFASRNGSVVAYAYDPSQQSFAFVDEESTAGRGTHVAVDPSGTHLFVAHYNEGALSALDFAVGSGFSNFRSFQPGQNAHQVTIDASGSHVFVPCLGSNYVAQYDLSSGGELSASSPATVDAAGGPRHMIFDASGSRAYVIAENSSQVHVFDVSSEGLLEPRPADSVYTSDDQQYHWSSDLGLTPDGRFLYAVNREPSQIVLFAVQGDGSLVRQAATQALDGELRAFDIEARGEYLLAGNGSGNLVSFRIGQDGSLSESARTTGLGNIHATVARYFD